MLLVGTCLVFCCSSVADLIFEAWATSTPCLDGGLVVECGGVVGASAAGLLCYETLAVGSGLLGLG